MNIIPPSLTKQRLIIYKNFSIIDLILSLFYIFISALIGYGFSSSFSTIYCFFISLICFCIFATTLLPNRKHHKKNYQVLLSWFKFHTGTKKYRRDSLTDTKLLLPYRKIVNHFLETDLLNTNSRWYIGALRITGFNIAILHKDEQLIKIQQLHSALQLIDLEMSIVKVNRAFNFAEQTTYLKKVLMELKQLQENNKISLESYERRVEQINNYLNNYTEHVQEGFPAKIFYIYLYAPKERELKNGIELAINKLLDAGLIATSLNEYEIINSIKDVFNNEEPDFSNELIDKYKLNLKELLRFGDVTFNKDHFKIGEQFYAINGIEEYPIFPDVGWLAKLTEIQSTVVINIQRTDRELIKRALHKAIINANTNLLSFKKVVDKSEQSYLIEAFQQLIGILASREETVKRVNILYLNHAQTLADLKQQKRSLKLFLKGQRYQINELIYEQFAGFSSLLLKPTDELQTKLGREMPTQTIAFSFPFLNNALIDNSGLLLGFNNMGDAINFDQFLLTGMRKNHNFLIMGQSGSGKSVTAKKLLNYHIAQGRKAIVIDPEREFKEICNYYDGAWIDVGNASIGRINPLQIMGQLTEAIDANENQWSVLIPNHLAFIEEWFITLFPNLSYDALEYLLARINDLYHHHLPLTKKKISDLTTNSFPIMDDLYKFLNKYKCTLNETGLHERVTALIANNFIGTTKYSNLYNGYSTINLNQQLVNVFDINNLFEKGNQRIIQAQLFLILAFIQNEIKINRYEKDQEVVILIDEAHLIIDEKNPRGLDFMFQMVKRIRKYRGGVILITQNPDDFMANQDIIKKTTAMLNNTQYSLIMNLSPRNLQDIDDMYKSCGGLSDSELEYIAKARSGSGLLMISPYERHCINVELTELELTAFDQTTLNRFKNNSIPTSQT